MEIILSFWNTIYGFLPKLPWIVIGLIFGWLIIKICMFFVKKAVRLLKLPKDIRGLLISLIHVSLWVLLVIIICQALGFGSLAFAISGSAVVLVFFLSNTVGPYIGNMISGLFLISDPDISVGMTVKLNDGKTEGEIIGIDMRKVRIKDEKGIIHVVPNHTVENNEWVVLKRKEAKGDKTK